MDFNKIAQEILELQNKVQAYQIRNNKLKELLTGLLKEHLKLEKKLEKMPVDGYSFWDGDNPTIVITKRLNRIDINDKKIRNQIT